MAILNVRNLPEDVHARLRVRAALNGRSMEAEARAILVAASLSEQPRSPAAELPAWVEELYEGRPPSGVVDELIAERRREAAAE